MPVNINLMNYECLEVIAHKCEVQAGLKNFEKSSVYLMLNLQFTSFEVTCHSRTWVTCHSQTWSGNRNEI